MRIALAVAVASTAAMAWVLLHRSESFVPWLEWVILVVGVLAGGSVLIPALTRGRLAVVSILAVMFAALGGVLWGALTALYRNRLPDVVIMFLVILGISVPSFVVAALAQLTLVNLNDLVGFGLLPVAGWGTIWHMLVPSMVLGLGTMAYLTRLMRSSMLEIVNSDYIRTAKAKGLPPTRIFTRHQLRNAILPVITVLGPSIAAITTGGFVVELVFAIPGLGRYFVQAVQQLDYTVIMGTTVFYGAFLVFMVIVVDLLYGWIDPRVRLE